MTDVKICGLKDPHAVTAAIEGGADFVGFVFYPHSPRYVEIETAAYLCSYLPDHIKPVGLFVDPTDALLEEVLSAVPLQMIQLHGDETPERVIKIKEHFSLPVMKAIPVASSDDLMTAAIYEDVADWMLFDTKSAALHGGTGQTFDWALLKDYPHQKPWMLAGGLNIDNISQALSALSPDAVDVSSGVESSRGIKDPEMITAFLKKIKNQ